MTSRDDGQANVLKDCPVGASKLQAHFANVPASDIRIIEFESTRLYFPTTMLANHLVDVPNQDRRMRPRDIPAQLEPELRQKECPGTVHRVIIWERYGAKGFLIPDVLVNGGHPNFGQNEGVSRLGIFAWKDGYRDLARGFRPGERSEFVIRQAEDVYVSIELPDQVADDASTLEAYRVRVADFFAWLKTPPPDRDEGRVFDFGSDS